MFAITDWCLAIVKNVAPFWCLFMSELAWRVRIRRFAPLPGCRNRLGSQRHGNNVLVTPRTQLLRPSAQAVVLALRRYDRRPGTLDQQGAQVDVPAFADAPALCRVADAVLAGHQPHPGRGISPALE